MRLWSTHDESSKRRQAMWKNRKVFNVKLGEDGEELSRYPGEDLMAVVCDVCGEETPDGEEGEWPPYKLNKDHGDGCLQESEVEVEYKHVVKTRVKMREHVSMWEDFMSERVTFDLCPRCFHEVLVPFLKSQGAKPRIRRN